MIIGHKRILDFLKKSASNKRLAHAYLFTGQAHLGKKRVATEFIKILNGQELGEGINPDVLIVEPEILEKEGVTKELEIGISQARKIQHQMSLSPYQALYKIALIDRAEKMTRDASNCLLKTLEEPIGKAILILITSNPQLLLPTIVSRCQLINFLPVREDEIRKGISSKSLDDKTLSQIIRLSNGRPGLAIQYLNDQSLLDDQNRIIGQLEKILRMDINGRYQYVEEIAKDVPKARMILNYWLFWFRDLLLLGTGCSDLVLYSQALSYKGSYSLPKLKKIIQAIKKTDWYLSNSSINARLALEVLMLEL